DGPRRAPPDDGPTSAPAAAASPTGTVVRYGTGIRIVEAPRGLGPGRDADARAGVNIARGTVAGAHGERGVLRREVGAGIGPGQSDGGGEPGRAAREVGVPRQPPGARATPRACRRQVSHHLRTA